MTATMNTEITNNTTMTAEEEINMNTNSELTVNNTNTTAEEETNMKIRFCDVDSSKKAEAFSRQDDMAKYNKLVYSGEGHYAFQMVKIYKHAVEDKHIFTYENCFVAEFNNKGEFNKFFQAMKENHKKLKLAVVLYKKVEDKNFSVEQMSDSDDATHVFRCDGKPLNSYWKWVERMAKKKDSANKRVRMQEVELSDALKQILIAQGVDPDKKHTPRTRRTKAQMAADKAAAEAVKTTETLETPAEAAETI